MGGGSGDFSGELRQKHAFKKLLIVEPSAEMLDAAHNNPQVDEAVTMTAEEWGADTTGDKLDRIMVKFAVHHLPEMPNTFKLLRLNKLEKDGRLLIITRPQFDIDLPWFEAANKVWSENSTGLDAITDALRSAGYSDVTVH